MNPDWTHQRRVAGKYAHGRKESRAMDRLAKFAEERADPGPVRVEDVRSFAEEIAEEVADGYNYATWGEMANQIPPEIAGRVCSHLSEALRLVEPYR